MRGLVNFYNKGFGWICRKCERELSSNAGESKHSRLMTEGEAESRDPRLSNSAIARWTDTNRTALFCPRCEITERMPE
jgi:hypothetical protein